MQTGTWKPAFWFGVAPALLTGAAVAASLVPYLAG
jgi:hypothetical protein